jgi:hypothetical protein
LEGEAANLGYGISGRANAGKAPQADESDQPGIGDPIPLEDPGQESAGENAAGDDTGQTRTGDSAGQGATGQGNKGTGTEGSGKLGN